MAESRKPNILIIWGDDIGWLFRPTASCSPQILVLRARPIRPSVSEWNRLRRQRNPGRLFSMSWNDDEIPICPASDFGSGHHSSLPLSSLPCDFLVSVLDRKSAFEPKSRGTYGCR